MLYTIFLRTFSRCGCHSQTSPRSGQPQNIGQMSIELAITIVHLQPPRYTSLLRYRSRAIQPPKPEEASTTIKLSSFGQTAQVELSYLYPPYSKTFILLVGSRIPLATAKAVYLTIHPARASRPGTRFLSDVHFENLVSAPA